MSDNGSVKGITASVARQEPSHVGTRRTRSPTWLASPRVLVLTSGLGCGHVRAADAIASAIQRLEPRSSVRQLDFWSLMNPGVAATIKRDYLSLVLDHPSF